MDITFLDFVFVFDLEFQKQRDLQNLFHFAMRLRSEFEALRSSILHRHPLTEAVAEFTSKEHISKCCHHYLLQFSHSPHP